MCTYTHTHTFKYALHASLQMYLTFVFQTACTKCNHHHHHHQHTTSHSTVAPFIEPASMNIYPRRVTAKRTACVSHRRRCRCANREYANELCSGVWCGSRAEKVSTSLYFLSPRNSLRKAATIVVMSWCVICLYVF